MNAGSGTGFPHRTERLWRICHALRLRIDLLLYDTGPDFVISICDFHHIHPCRQFLQVHLEHVLMVGSSHRLTPYDLAFCIQ
jgi:hypothetical protein